MKNPIEKAREQQNLNINELALLAGVTERTVRWNERGENMAITDKLLNCLSEQGFDKERLIRDYERFREWRKKQLLQEVKQRA
ncbi:MULTISPECIES: hypothetical protein [Bacillati]|uniref:HTH cro/C1-type domain-containing protein n=1 Tax=Halobacillus naozhouensis TaxID=554880 RepID=A0ABY8J3N0_9BACI|nr:hypothetical protein [Halobacillus naozhouensis]WFT77098.1 hypothetical protein P9989_21440 [Halobacillus naozhouensis]